MSDNRMLLSEKEKIARTVTGIDSDATFFNVDDRTLDKMIDDNKRSRFNDKIEEMNRKLDEHSSKLQEYADEYAKKLDGGMEIMPISRGLLVQPYAENPFQKVKVTDSGIIYDLGGMTPEYKNNDNGEYEEAEQYILVGVVVESGPECKWCKKGDTVMWNKPSMIPVPFYSMGLVHVREESVICVINNGLKDRFFN